MAAQLNLLDVIILLDLIDCVAALQNSTTPERTNWAPSPTERGTVDILWSCLLTLLACSWTILHLNIPSKRDGALIKFGRKVGWMSIAIIAPEFVTMQACSQWIHVSKSIPIMRSLGLQDWETTHGFYAEMGGFVVEFDDKSYYTLDFDLLVWYIENGHLTVNDITISAEDIQDHSKADLFTKGVTCLQSLWLVLQCIARTAQHLPVSQLELATCAYVVCALITYWFWRDKPLDANRQTTIGRVLRKEVLSQMLDRYPDNSNLSGEERARRLQSLGPIGGTMVGGAVLYFVGLLFCSLHLLAWNYDFPTSAELFHWRVFAASGTGASGLLLILLVPYWGSRYFKIGWLGWHDSGRINPNWELLCFPLMVLSALLYLAARFYLVFAMFYSLRSMPCRVYKMVNWTTYLPNFN